MSQIGKNAELPMLAIIADVVGSREAANRQELQRTLLDALARMSAELKRRLWADLQLTAGDELQGLCRDPAAAIPVLVGISDAIHPSRITFGLGWGRLSTPLPARRGSRRLPLLDGACFHAAREALAEARARDAWGAGWGFGPWEEPLCALLELIGSLRRGWTAKQGAYAAAARHQPQKDVAAHYGVSPSVVSESLKAARVDVVRRGEAGLIALLQHFGSATESGLASAKGPKSTPGTGGRARRS